MIKAGVVIDGWKLDIFQRLLKQNGYAYEQAGKPSDELITLVINTENVEALGEVVKKANKEAALTGRQHGK